MAKKVTLVGGRKIAPFRVESPAIRGSWSSLVRTSGRPFSFTAVSSRASDVSEYRRDGRVCEELESCLAGRAGTYDCGLRRNISHQIAQGHVVACVDFGRI